MSAQFQEQPLFGGAIIGTIPQGWIDASNLRTVPDHQEIFLSTTTLSNLIIEINEYVSEQEAPVPASAANTVATISEEDKVGLTAALYHLRDLCDEGDTMEIVDALHRVHPVKLTVSAASVGVSVLAFAGVVKFTTLKKRRGHQEEISTTTTIAGSATASSSSAAGPERSVHSSHFLLVRLPEKGTDLLVFVNVPHDEFVAQGNPDALAREEAGASALVVRFIETFDVLDWNLFG